MSARGAARRKLIADAARSRLTSLGYEGTSIGDLATDLGISKAAIAYYFPTKDTFLDEFVTPFLDELDERIEAATGPEEAVRAYLTTIIAHHDLAVWVDTDPTVQNDPHHGARLADINRRVTKLVTAGSRRRADAIRALGVLGGVWRPAREISTAELTQHFDEIVDAALASY